jgi:hypothetical protein
MLARMKHGASGDKTGHLSKRQRDRHRDQLAEARRALSRGPPARKRSPAVEAAGPLRSASRVLRLSKAVAVACGALGSDEKPGVAVGGPRAAVSLAEPASHTGRTSRPSTNSVPTPAHSESRPGSDQSSEEAARRGR